MPIPGSIEELERIREECKSMATKRAGISAGAAIVPVPAADIGVDVALLLEMIPAINRKFGLDADQIDELDPQTKKMVLVLATSMGSELIGKAITKDIIVQILKKLGIRIASKQVAKYIPFLGQAVAATISFGAMKMLGNSHVDDCYEVARRALEAKVPVMA